MGFESQSEKSKVSSRRGSKAGIVVSQTYKPSTDSEEMSFRVDASLLNGFGAKVEIVLMFCMIESLVCG